MSRSARFITLTKELNRLKKQFLPKINPIGTYSDRQLALTIAYRVLAHAEIEAYLEDRVKQLAIDAKRDWDNQDKTSRTLLSLVAHSSATSYRTRQPPDPADELNRVQQITQGLLQIDELINTLNPN